MKKVISVFLPLLLLFCTMALPVSAVSEDSTIVSQETIYEEDGSYYTITIREEPAVQTRSGASKNGSKTLEYTAADGLGWTLTVTGSFIYPGTNTGSAYCISASDSNRTYNGWSCSSSYATYSGNTATAYGTFTRTATKSGSVSISCSPTGELY